MHITPATPLTNYLWPKEEEAELREGEEDDEEHDGEPAQVLPARTTHTIIKGTP